MKVAPGPSVLLWTVIAPPCATTRCLAIARPRPALRPAREASPDNAPPTAKQPSIDAPGESVGDHLYDADIERPTITLADVARLTVSIAKMRPFIVTSDWRPTLLTDRADLRALVAPKVKQLDLFAA